MANVLIVDDSRTSRKILRSILEENNYTIVGEAKNGEEGVSSAKELNPDLITLDITMPVLDGIEALKQIREYNPDAKVIMVTAAGQKDKMVTAVKLGACDFIAKPFDQKLLLSTLEHVLNS